MRLPLLFTPANKWEASMWEFVAPHQREILDFSPLLGGPLSWQSLADISRKFSMRFRAKITNAQITEENGGVTPHMLRHARTYDLHIIEGYPDYVVQRIMGWNKRDMIDRYEDIRAALNIRELKEIYVLISKMFKGYVILENASNSSLLEQPSILSKCGFREIYAVENTTLWSR